MKMTRWVSLIVILLFANVANSLEIKFHPSDRLFLNGANLNRGTYDVIAHLLVVKNNSKTPVTLERIDLQLKKDGWIIQQIHLLPAELLNATKSIAGMKAEGMEIMADFIVPSALLGTDGKFGNSAELQPGEVLIAQNIYMTVQKVPDLLYASAVAKDAAQNSITHSTEIKIVQYKSPNKYTFPLEGVWYMQAVPNVTSHHRWMPQTEFGIDFLKLNEAGLPYKNDRKSRDDYYGYGQPVLAVADGVVVKAINDAEQNWDAWFPREGETDEEFSKRAQQYQIDAMKKDIYKAVTGNVVVIEHAGGEYSAYAHLKTGSVGVKTGDRVQQGQKIGEVGDTGDYFMAHLHFQISDSADLLRARSLPFEFVNLRKQTELGHFSAFKKN